MTPVIVRVALAKRATVPKEATTSRVIAPGLGPAVNVTGFDVVELRVPAELLRDQRMSTQPVGQGPPVQEVSAVKVWVASIETEAETGLIATEARVPVGDDVLTVRAAVVVALSPCVSFT